MAQRPTSAEVDVERLKQFICEKLPAEPTPENMAKLLARAIKACTLPAKTAELVPGEVDAEHLRLLIGDRLQSETLIGALYGHLVDGKRPVDVRAEWGVNKNIFFRALRDLRASSSRASELSAFY